MTDIILKPGTFLAINKSAQTSVIPGVSLENYIVGLLKNPTCCAKYVTLTKGSVTQATSITTGVTLNSPSGTITTVALTTAANTAEAPFTVTNSYVKADSVIVANVIAYGGSTVINDLPMIYIDKVVAGSFKVIVGNGGAGTLDGTVTIAFAIL